MILLRSYIGQELRRVRQEKQMSLRDTASAACVSLGYLSEVERGLKEVSSELLQSMCGALELPVSALLSEVTGKLVLDELEELLDMTPSVNFLEVDSRGTRMDRLTSAQPLSMMKPMGRYATQSRTAGDTYPPAQRLDSLLPVSTT